MSKISKVILFHGLGDNENSNRFPWLKCVLQTKGIKTFIPSLPLSNKPDLHKQLNYVIETYQYLLDEKTILIGHSLGAILAKHFLLKSIKKIKKLILVGPAFKQQKIDHLLQNENISKGVSHIQNYISNNIDENKVKNLCAEYLVYLSKNDPYILFDYAKKYFSDLNIILREFEDKGHFSDLNGNLFEFYELLKDIV